MVVLESFEANELDVTFGELLEAPRARFEREVQTTANGKLSAFGDDQVSIQCYHGPTDRAQRHVLLKNAPATCQQALEQRHLFIVAPAAAMNVAAATNSVASASCD